MYDESKYHMYTNLGGFFPPFFLFFKLTKPAKLEKNKWNFKAFDLGKTVVVALTLLEAGGASVDLTYLFVRTCYSSIHP